MPGLRVPIFLGPPVDRRWQETEKTGKDDGTEKVTSSQRQTIDRSNCEPEIDELSRLLGG
jgi:hypothetical protein